MLKAVVVKRWWADAYGKRLVPIRGNRADENDAAVVERTIQVFASPLVRTVVTPSSMLDRERFGTAVDIQLCSR